MLQQLAHDTGAQGWVVGSLVFFVAAFALVVIRVLRTPAAVHRTNAELPLDDDSEAPEGESSSR